VGVNSGEHFFATLRFTLPDILNYPPVQEATIIAQDFKLISPPIGFLEFPHWGSNPRFVSDVQIKTIEWSPPDKDFPYGGCIVRLVYRHEAPVMQGKKEQKTPKSLSFKFIRDQAGNLVY
jgi:hypothetical protein